MSKIVGTSLVVAVDIDTGWWIYRVHRDGRVLGKCPDEPVWLKVLKDDLDDEEVSYSELIAAATEAFQQAGLK